MFEYPYDEPFDEGKETLKIKPLDHWLNAYWLIIMTVTTVGYGDVYPRTKLGKMVACATAIWGTVVISLIVMSSIKFFDPNSKEL